MELLPPKRDEADLEPGASCLSARRYAVPRTRRKIQRSRDRLHTSAAGVGPISTPLGSGDGPPPPENPPLPCPIVVARIGARSMLSRRARGSVGLLSLALEAKGPRAAHRAALTGTATFARGPDAPEHAP